MKSRITLIVCSAIVAAVVSIPKIALTQNPGTAGGPPPASPQPQAVPGHRIAIVDVGQVFKKHTIFNKELETMKARVTAAETKMRTDAENMKRQTDQLKQMQPSSPDFRTLESNLARQQMEFNLNRETYKRDFAEQESQLYYRLYLQIDEAVQRIAVHNGFALVLRHTTDPIKEDDRNEIMRAINKPIIYYKPELDITETVVGLLNGEGRPLTGPGQQPPANNQAGRAPVAPIR